MPHINARIAGKSRPSTVVYFDETPNENGAFAGELLDAA